MGSKGPLRGHAQAATPPAPAAKVARVWLLLAAEFAALIRQLGAAQRVATDRAEFHTALASPAPHARLWPACGRRPSLRSCSARSACVWSLRGGPSGRPLRFVVAPLVAHAARAAARGAPRPELVGRFGRPPGGPAAAGALPQGGRPGSPSPAVARLCRRRPGRGLVGLPGGAGGCPPSALCFLGRPAPSFSRPGPPPSPVAASRRRLRRHFSDRSDVVSAAPRERGKTGQG